MYNNYNSPRYNDTTPRLPYIAPNNGRGTPDIAFRFQDQVALIGSIF